MSKGIFVNVKKIITNRLQTFVLYLLRNSYYLLATRGLIRWHCKCSTSGWWVCSIGTTPWRFICSTSDGLWTIFTMCSWKFRGKIMRTRFETYLSINLFIWSFDDFTWGLHWSTFHTTCNWPQFANCVLGAARVDQPFQGLVV